LWRLANAHGIGHGRQDFHFHALVWRPKGGPAILSQKGGSGRTTLTLHLAVAALYDGQSVAIIDLDPQASAAGWKDSRPGDDPVVVPIPHTRLPQAHAGYRPNPGLPSVPLYFVEVLVLPYACMLPQS